MEELRKQEEGEEAEELEHLVSKMVRDEPSLEVELEEVELKNAEDGVEHADHRCRPDEHAWPARLYLDILDWRWAEAAAVA